MLKTAIVMTAMAVVGLPLLVKIRDDLVLNDAERLLEEIANDTDDYDYGTRMQYIRHCRAARDQVNRIACTRKHTSRQYKRAQKALKTLYYYAPYSTC